MERGLCKTLLWAIEASVVFSLCVIYSLWIAAIIVFDYCTKYETKFWITKDHNVKPKALSNPDFGEHKFIAVNVSKHPKQHY